ncbi:MAG TPA: hypothetical protein VI704_04935, partial [Bacteroidota bacterium]|nr:hypothetical protein [Bacteroidota bacterium]
MNVFTALGLGFQQSKKSIQMIFLLYGINLLLALPLAMAFRSTLIRSFDNSLAVETMLKDFDATVYSDFMKYHGKSIWTLLSQIPWLLVLYMVSHTLTAGGVISWVNDQQPFSLSAFFEKCGRFFYRLLKLLTMFA